MAGPRFASRVALLTALLSTSCGDDEAASPPPAPTAPPMRAPRGEAAAQPAPRRPDRPAAAPAAPAPTVVLLDAGKQPRRELRYQLAPPSREKLSMTVQIAMQMENGPDKAKTRLPGIRMQMELAVAEKLPDGRARCEFKVTGVELLPGDAMFDAVRDQLVAELRKAIGAAGTLTVDDRGLNRELVLDLPPDMDPQMRESMERSRQAMEQISAPLPREPIGRGARWQVKQLASQSGLKVEQTTELELVELAGKKLSLKTAVVQSASPQVVTMPNLSPGFTTELLSHTGTGRGRTLLDLHRLVPRRSTMRIETVTGVRVVGQGQDQTMEVVGDTELSVGRK